MKRWAAFASTIILVSSALVWSEMRRIDTPVGPEPILNFIADTERELTRLPVAFAPLPEAEEVKIGRELEKAYVNVWQRSQDDQAQDVAIEKYVQRVGSAVAAKAHRKLQYRFHYIPNIDFINAFALPGGPVFIGAGLMALMETEDELAAILGHEVEHIDHYHCAERIQVQAALHQVPLGELISLPVEIFVVGYTKNQELEADREGAKLAAASSYTPLGAIQMFEALERVYPAKSVQSGTPQEELSNMALKTLEGYFRTHPLNAERIDQIRKMINDGDLPNWKQTKPFPIAYVFLTDRALRSLRAAQTRPNTPLTKEESRKRESDRVREQEQAVKLASQSLHLQPDQPRALEIVAIAILGLGDYAAARETYRKLLPRYPRFADEVRVYADTAARQALEAQQYDKAARLAGESLQLQPDQPGALEILAEAQFWLSDFTGAAQTSDKLKNMYPEAADTLRIYADRLATQNFEQQHYREAASLAAQSLELKPGQREPLIVFAKAQFALGDFSSAATAYRKLLDQDPSDISLVRSYADALSTANPTMPTAQEFQTWLTGIKPGTPALATQMQIELAGLMLMTGNDTLAKSLAGEAQGPDRGPVTPESLGRLGWWYFRSGDYAKSAIMLRQAVEQRPGVLSLQTAMAWNELEQHQLDNAIRRFTAAVMDMEWNSPVMGRAVAFWQAHHTEDALKDFDTVAKTFPEWRNPHWVDALYPASVARTVAEMQAEWENRHAARHRNL